MRGQAWTPALENRVAFDQGARVHHIIVMVANPERVPVCEDHPTVPTSPYGSEGDGRNRALWERCLNPEAV